VTWIDPDGALRNLAGGPVFINGAPAGRVGDAIFCGGAADEGSTP